MTTTNKENYFNLYSCCIPVKGAVRTAVCDLQRNDFVFVPNVVHELLTQFRGQAVEEILAAFDHKHDDQIREYFDYLEACEMGFYTEDAPVNFPPMDLDYRVPNPVANAIIDRSPESEYALEPIVSQLSELYCNYVEIRYYHPISVEEIAGVVAKFEDSTLRAVNFVVGYHPSMDEGIGELLINNKRIKQMIIHGHPEREESVGVDMTTTLIFTKTHIKSEEACGGIHPTLFRCGTEAFAESTLVNNCLYKKISVDKDGNIKNCPSMPTSFGHISETTLAEVLEQKNFQKHWNTTKDDVSECKDCEFRYICHDCRVYLKNPEDELSKPAKCTYDPYKAEWQPEAAPVEHNLVG